MTHPPSAGTQWETALAAVRGESPGGDPIQAAQDAGRLIASMVGDLLTLVERNPRGARVTATAAVLDTINGIVEAFEVASQPGRRSRVLGLMLRIPPIVITCSEHRERSGIGPCRSEATRGGRFRVGCPLPSVEWAPSRRCGGRCSAVGRRSSRRPSRRPPVRASAPVGAGW